ncbi:triose-phosphate isomerase [Ferruginibacter sp. HRS2-29]|uniref:triose-phosphate isomerase n=1 Tax=Ferruginibacter sp. HRS2-29 TaxID=2487334 RepID=UPI0020CB747D|nr:triose-phosphate isomerase [Ferruginibacter sp. HRS2-29]MCP9751443.1 triose-phosphate isomerase [Ferruginibacter sp. HRS2-29]
MRKQIAAANWKMNLTLQQAEQLTDELLAAGISLKEDQLAIFGVPFPYITKIREKLEGTSRLYVAAQNCSANKNGAYTGEVSAEMLNSIGLKYVIIGHSERREYNHEDNALLAKKVDIAFENGLQPIFCCGEPLQIRETETQNTYVETQLNESLFHLSAEQMKNFIIAYEPIWAIGTGRTASNEQAQEMHAHIRQVLASKYGAEIADTVSILYGGSVKAANAKDIFGQPDVDGGLVGGASLIATEFAAIIASLK